MSNSPWSSSIRAPKTVCASRRWDKSWRHEHALLIRRLSDAGASVIAFDIYLEGSSLFDKELIKAAEAARAKGTRVVFASNGGSQALKLPESAVEVGLACIGNELDWTRLVPLVVRRQRAANPSSAAAEPEYVASLGAVAAKPGATIHYLDMENRWVILKYPGGTEHRMLFSRIEDVSREQECAALAPGDQVAQRFIRFSRLELLRDPNRRHRYQDLLGTPVAPGASEYRGKIFLVGDEVHDPARQVFRGIHVENRYGYEIHADVINTLLHDGVIRALPPLPQFFVTLAMGLLGMVGRFWPWLWCLSRRRAYVCGVPLAYVAMSVWLCAEFQILLSSTYHLGAFALAYWVSDLTLRSARIWDTGRI